MVEAFLQVLDQLDQPIAHQQVGGVGRLGPGGDHRQALVLGGPQDGVDVVAARQQVADARDVPQPEGRVDRRRAQVGVHEHHLAPRARQGLSQGDGGRRLALARPRADHRQGLGRALGGGELEIGLHREIGLDEARARVLQRVQRRLGLQPGRHAQQRQAELLFEIGGLGDALVDLFEHRRHGRAQHRPGQHEEQQIDHQPRRGGPVGLLGRIDHGDVVVLDRAGDADLLIALEQGAIEFAVGVRVPLEDVVLDRALAQVGERSLQAVDPLAQGLLAARGGLIGLLQRGADPVLFHLDRRVEGVDLGLQGLGGRIVGLELDHQLGVFRGRVRALLAHHPDRLVVQGLAGGVRMIGLGQAALGLDAVGGGRLAG